MKPWLRFVLPPLFLLLAILLTLALSGNGSGVDPNPPTPGTPDNGSEGPGRSGQSARPPEAGSDDNPILEARAVIGDGSSVPGAPPSETTELAPFFTTTVRGGVEAAGVGLPQTGTGEIILDDIPTRSIVTNAFLYWTVLADTLPESTILLNSTLVQGTLIGSGPSPNRAQKSHFTFRADVTSTIRGNGKHRIQAVPHRAEQPPSRDEIVTEGAPIVAVFDNPHFPETAITLNDGSVLLSNRRTTTTLRNFVVSRAFTGANLFTFGADGQGRFGDAVLLNEKELGRNLFNGSDGIGWDTDEFFVEDFFQPGDDRAVVSVDVRRPTVTSEIRNDSVVWVGALLAVRQTNSNPAGLIDDIIDLVQETVENEDARNRVLQQLRLALLFALRGLTEDAVIALREAINEALLSLERGVPDDAIEPLLNDIPVVIAQIFQDQKKTILVNFKFGKGTTKNEDKRKKMTDFFMKTLQDFLVVDEKDARFCVNFKLAKVSDVDDVPEEVKAGGFTNGPGSYEYTKEGIDIIKKHGNKRDEKKITVIIVKNLTNAIATTFAPDPPLDTKNGDQLGDSEGIMYDEGDLENPPFTSTPAHEVTHLAGAPDVPDPKTNCYEHLNGGKMPRSKKLPEDLEKAMKEYFKKKTKEPKE